MFLALLFFVVVRFLPLWCDCSDPLVSFVHETVLGFRSWMGRLGAGVRNTSFVVHTVVQCVVEVFFFEKQELTPFLLVTVGVKLAFVA